MTDDRNALGLRYRPDIDGLRGIAVLSVLFYHLTLSYCPGGFVGVDVFFVISGYLITSILVREMDQGTFSFRAFYVRRMRRIFPALTVVVVASTAVSIALLPPGQLRIYGDSLVAMTVFASNLYFRKHAPENGYFSHDLDPRPLLHTWSLSVEEQFYLLFPVFLTIVYRYSKRFRIEWAILALTAISFGVSLLYELRDTIGNFYLLPTRAWELLAGGLLAVGFFPKMTRRWVRELSAWFGLGMIVFAVNRYTSETAFPGSGALMPVIGAALILAAGEVGESTANQILRFQPLVWTGLISYSLYLWHWPIVRFARYYFCSPDGSLTDQATWIVLIASVAIAAFSYRLVESPFRGRASKIGDRRTIRLSVAATLCLVACGGVLIRSHRIAGGFSAHTGEIMARNEERQEEKAPVPECTFWRIDLKRYSDGKFCEFGNSSGKILLWGDSHAGQIAPLLIELARRDELGHRGLVLAIAPGCPEPSTHLTKVDPGFGCDQFARFTMQRAMKSDVDTVYLQFNPWWTQDGLLCASADGNCTRALTAPEARAQFLGDLADTIHTLHAAGKRVVLGMPFPTYGLNVPNYEMRHARLGRFFRLKPLTLPDRYREALLDVAAREKAGIYDPRSTLCPQQRCTFDVDGVSIMRDDGHIAPSQAGLLRQGLLKSLVPPAPEAVR